MYVIFLNKKLSAKFFVSNERFAIIWFIHLIHVKFNKLVNFFDAFKQSSAKWPYATETCWKYNNKYYSMKVAFVCFQYLSE